MIQPFLPLLAAGGTVTLIILTISILSWLFSLFQDKKAPVAPRNKPKSKNSSQAELERFLREVEQKNESQQPRPSAPKPRPSGGERKRPKPSQSPAQAQSARNAPATRQPVARLAQTPLMMPSALGEGVRTHVSSHLAPRDVDNRVEKDIDENVRRDIDSNVQRDLGLGLGKDSTYEVQRSEVVHPLMRALRNPQGVRQAILLAEILNRPKSTR